MNILRILTYHHDMYNMHIMKNETTIRFGKRLKQARLFNNFTLQRSADAINVALRTYQNYEAGDRFPSPDALVLIAKTFNVSLDYLLGISDEAPFDER